MASIPQPRPSSATTHSTPAIQHNTTPSRAASIATTVADDTHSLANTAVEDGSIEDDGTTTPRALSLAPTLVESRTTYRGFPSEAAYRAAFHEWAESKRYIQQEDTALIGFYGTTTMEEFAARPRIEFGLSKKWRERKEKKQQRQQSQKSSQQQQGRRKTVA